MSMKIKNYDSYRRLLNFQKSVILSKHAKQPDYTLHKDEDGREYFISVQSDETVKKIYLDEQFPNLGQEEGRETGDLNMDESGEYHQQLSHTEETFPDTGDHTSSPSPDGDRASPNFHPGNEEASSNPDDHRILSEPIGDETSNGLDADSKETLIEPDGYRISQDPVGDEPSTGLGDDQQALSDTEEVMHDHYGYSNTGEGHDNFDTNNHDGVYDNYVKVPSLSSGKGSHVDNDNDDANTHPSGVYEPQLEQSDVTYIRETVSVDHTVSSPKKKPQRQNENDHSRNRKFQRPKPKYESPKKPYKYQPKPKPGQPTAMVGGMLIIDNDPWKPSSKVDHKNEGYIKGGGDVEIMTDKLQWNRRPKVDHWNGRYKRGGGNVVIMHENLPWRKNAKRIIKPPPPPPESMRSVSNQDIHGAESPDLYSVSARSKSVEPQVGYTASVPYTSSYASRYKGMGYRHKIGSKSLPPIDPKGIKVTKLEEVLIPLPEEGPEKPPIQETSETFEQVPDLFKPSPRNLQKLKSRPPFRLPSKYEPIPNLDATFDEEHSHERKPPVNRKSVAAIEKTKSKPLNQKVSNKKEPPKWHRMWKEPKLEKITSKTLDKVSLRNVDLGPNKDYVDDNYGGYYYYDEMNNTTDYYYDSGYSQDYQEYSQDERTDKFYQIESQQSSNFKKRNQPLYTL